MKPINESSLKLSLDSGSTKRLASYQKRLSKNHEDEYYDDQAVRRLRDLALTDGHRKMIDKELHYLHSLVGDDGYPYCRSRGNVADIEKQFDNFLKPEKSSFRWNRNYIAAVEKVKARYASAKLRMLKYSDERDIKDAVTDWSTSTGWTKIKQGKSKKVEVLDGVLVQTLLRERRAKENCSFGSPIICATRTQASGAYAADGSQTGSFKRKMRAVFMVDVYTIISESRFGAPLNLWLKDYRYSAIGKDDLWISTFVDLERGRNGGFISLDYSKYDSTIPSWLIRSAFDVIRCAFEEYDDKLLSAIEEDFINKVVVTHRGVEFFSHGNPSGSRLTAIINGICNEIITETWFTRFGVTGMYNIMGDDNLIYYHIAGKPLDIGLVATYIEHNFGITVNSAKSQQGSSYADPEYLSRYWGAAGPYRSVGEVVSLIAYPERFRNYRDKRSRLDPDLILWSYCLAYPSTMAKLIDTKVLNRKFADFRFNNDWTIQQREAVPYNVRTWMEWKMQRGNISGTSF